MKSTWGIGGELATIIKRWPLFRVGKSIGWDILGVWVGDEGFLRIYSNITDSGIALIGTKGDTIWKIFHLVLLWGIDSSWNLGYLKKILALLLVSLRFGGARVQNIDWLIVESLIRLKEPYNLEGFNW